MRKCKYLFFALCICAYANAQFASTDRSHYSKGDTIVLSCIVKDFKKDSTRFASLYVYVENVDTKKRWSLRYPLIDGQLAANLVVDSAISDGRYAFNFVVRKSFFSMRGFAADQESAKLSYSMFTKKGDTYFNDVTTDRNGNFSLRGVLFEDTCYFIFSKLNTPDLTVEIDTRLDSAFTPDRAETHFVYIGKADTLSSVLEANYKSDIESFETMSATLPEVTVTGLKKKKIELFDKEFSTGLFQNPAARVFDGLESSAIENSQDILDFLKTHVAGLQVSMANDGTYTLQWRGPNSFRGGTNVDFFLDEFKVNSITRGLVSTGDIAMVKAYPPPAYLSAGGVNGAIAIYTKRGQYGNSRSRNKFRVFGYTPVDSVWR